MFGARPRFETEAQGNSEIVFTCNYVTTPENFISTFRPTVHTYRHENEAFRKRSSNRRKLRTPALRFLVDGKAFEAFRER